jgi:glutathione S-transferase
MRRQLRHFPLSPFCRKVRLVLGEKTTAFESKACNPWELGLALQELPVLIEPEGCALVDARAISEYLNDIMVDPPLLPATPQGRAEARRWINFFDEQFWLGVTSIVLDERVLKRFDAQRERQPDLARLKLAQQTLRSKLRLVENHFESSGSFAGKLGLADLTAAAHFSCLDYFGDIPWNEFKLCREWYARIKSRPSFRALLNDSLPGFAASEHYQDLDF